MAYIANNSRNQRPSVPKFGRKVPPTLDATRVPVSRSKGQRSASPSPLMLTHILRHIFRMRTDCIPQVVVVGVTLGVFFGHLRINLHQTRTQYSNEGLQLSPIFENRFLNLEFRRRKTVICQFRPSKQQDLLLLLADRSIAMTSRPRPMTFGRRATVTVQVAYRSCYTC